MRRILTTCFLIVAGCAGSVRAQAPALINDEYRFPFWSDGDVGGPGPFHFGYRTGFVITNPNDELMTVDLVLYDSDGGIANLPLSDGQVRQRLVRPHATINITTPALWQSPQHFGQVRANGNFPFLISVQVELVRIQDPAIAPTNLDPRISVMRMEASRTPVTVFISWERSATTDTAFIFSNTSSEKKSGLITAYSGLMQGGLSVTEVTVPANGTIITTISDFNNSFSPVVFPAEARNQGVLKVQFGAGTVMSTGVVFRTVQDPIVMPAAIASQ
ncbi:MAG TPA: hypothetical protein VGL91_08710 [Acidobacteriota bacterium]|jgi:hypothetical protein